MEGGGSDETSRIFSGQVNFPKMNGGISVYGGEKSNNHRGGLVITNNTLQK